MSGGRVGERAAEPGGSGQPAEAGETSAARPTDERFDEILGRLRTLVDKLEGGNLPLEDGLRFFEEGVALCRRGGEILDRAEKRVEVLLSHSTEGTRVAPLGESGSRADSE
jgi:exodeoxyribonuclease VII small subunit